MNLFDAVWIAAVLVFVGSIAVLVKYRRIQSKYGAVINVDSEVARLRGEIEKLRREREATTVEEAARREQLSSQYNSGLVTYEHLKKEIALLEENLEDMSFGVYKPHYDFDTSEKYKKELEQVWEQKKEMVRSRRAALCATEWTVSGSKQEGARMVKKMVKVMLRAFNGEADAAIAKVSWNNVEKMEDRLRKAYEAINDLGSVNRISISQDYLDLALAELRLSYEYERKKRDEQEEQRAIRERMREEERAQREFEKAQQEAATEEDRYKRALERARVEVEAAKGEEIARANERVRELEEKLAQAQAKMQRALSMAQQTRCGHIYIISSLGSFGERVFKIGMTRRLDPMDRVHELGDASVPFQFDVHAMIYSEDAPTLENAFHRRFGETRVNLVNPRKEFFNLDLEDIERFAREQNVTIEFTRLAEAREFRETLAIREKAAAMASAPEPEKSRFPDALQFEPVAEAPAQPPS
jgi:hypothetical protein